LRPLRAPQVHAAAAEPAALGWFPGLQPLKATLGAVATGMLRLAASIRTS